MTEAPLLLDTCAAIWLLDPEGPNPAAVEAVEQADAAGAAVHISPISAWEVGMLVSRGRLALTVPPARWFADILDAKVQLAPMTPEILIASSFLPGGLHGDPADRIIAATARALGSRVLTRDRKLLDYGAAGHIRTVVC